MQNKGAIVVSHNYDLLKKESSKDSQESFQNGTIKSIKTKVGEKLPLQKGSGIDIENNIDSSFVFLNSYFNILQYVIVFYII